MGTIRMGAWDCDYCNKKAIPGNLRECPGCGNPRGENVSFYLPSDAKPVEDINDKIKVTKKGKIKITKNGCFF